MTGVRRAKFETELVEGHKGVVVAIVPFDPADVFGQKPIRLAGRRHGWPVKGSLNSTRFDGYVGERWGKFFIIVDREVRAVAACAAGARVSITLAPSLDLKTVEQAIQQSKQTTQPAKARADAVAFAKLPPR